MVYIHGGFLAYGSGRAARASESGSRNSLNVSDDDDGGDDNDGVNWMRARPSGTLAAGKFPLRLKRRGLILQGFSYLKAFVCEIISLIGNCLSFELILTIISSIKITLSLSSLRDGCYFCGLQLQATGARFYGPRATGSK